MARCNGYRPRKAVRAEVQALRAELGKLRGAQWQRAQVLMSRMTALMGREGGPSRANIAPRACAYCGYFGHTRQFCTERARAEEREVEREVQRHEAWKRSLPERKRSAGQDAWCAWIAWVDRRNSAAFAAGCVCTRVVKESAADEACGRCEGCASWERFCERWPEPEPHLGLGRLHVEGLLPGLGA